MSYRITADCVNCWACEPLCPNAAVLVAKPHFIVDPSRCNGCEGDYPDPQCVSICPIKGAILDPTGAPANPPGSLTSVPPEAKTPRGARLQAG